MIAKTLGCQLHNNSLMQETCINFYAKNILIQLDIANLLVCDVINCYCRHYCLILLPN